MDHIIPLPLDNYVIVFQRAKTALIPAKDNLGTRRRHSAWKAKDRAPHRSQTAPPRRFASAPSPGKVVHAQSQPFQTGGITGALKRAAIRNPGLSLCERGESPAPTGSDAEATRFSRFSSFPDGGDRFCGDGSAERESYRKVLGKARLHPDCELGPGFRKCDCVLHSQPFRGGWIPGGTRSWCEGDTFANAAVTAVSQITRKPASFDGFVGLISKRRPINSTAPKPGSGWHRRFRSAGCE